MTGRGVPIAIAFRHYAKEVVTIAEAAAAREVPLITLTDSQLSPLAKDARVLFTIAEGEYTFSRSLAAPMCLIQSIATATAIRLHPNTDQTPRIPTVTETLLRKQKIKS